MYSAFHESGVGCADQSETPMLFPRIVRRFVLAIAVLGALPATATDTGPQVQVLEAYTAATKSRQKNADVYARFVNVETTDRLVGADSPACDRVELVGAR